MESPRPVLPSHPIPPADQVFDKPREVTSSGKKKDIPIGVWTRCKGCGEMLTNMLLDENQKVCPKCQYHFTARASERLEWLADEDSFEEVDDNLSSVDALGFKGVSSYIEKLTHYQKSTGLVDAVISGFCKIDGHKTGLAIMDFSFLGASMGSVVGERITRIIEKSTKKKLPVILINASGGARMYEGMLSLMQMAKTSGALARHAQAGLPYISVLTNPTMAGVMASYASLGDIIVSEPQAMVGFAGARVIRETTREKLPAGFQTAEFLLDRGLIDMIVHRKKMKSTLANLLDFMGC
ncbi:MAG: acetyl-CoA carboxylase, carboxyltransferase subunit beta [Verrucomicrobiae bacterium]|nr:acetyl-CoA carboxylase, carboxyltransferase subunit beta [Verrucomicrobiae bacterium]